MPGNRGKTDGKGGKVVFRRVRGKIIPIKVRGDSGVDQRTKSRAANFRGSDISKIFKEKGRSRTGKERFRETVGLSIVGAAVGLLPAGIALGSGKTRLAAKIVAGTAFLGGLAGATQTNKVLSNRKFTQELGIRQSKRLKIKRRRK